MLKILSFLLLFSAVSYSQSATEIRQGTTLLYIVYTDGDELSLSLVVDSVSASYLRFAWTIDGYGSGKWIMTKNSLENATRGYWEEPMAGTEQQLGDDHNVLLFSKAQMNSVKSNKSVTYEGEAYTVKPVPADQKFELERTEINTLYMENANGSAKIWVLDNADFPAIVKFIGNPTGIDIQLASIR